jgi:hypothetical protein
MTGFGEDLRPIVRKRMAEAQGPRTTTPDDR